MSVDNNGTRKSNNWLDQRKSNKSGHRTSHLVRSAHYPVLLLNQPILPVHKHKKQGFTIPRITLTLLRLVNLDIFGLADMNIDKNTKFGSRSYCSNFDKFRGTAPWKGYARQVMRMPLCYCRRVKFTYLFTHLKITRQWESSLYQGGTYEDTQWLSLFPRWKSGFAEKKR